MKDAGYTLTIFNEDDVVVYTETYGSYSVGPVMAYVDIAAATNNDANFGTGLYASKDFESGEYSYTFTCGTTSTRGTFTVD